MKLKNGDETDEPTIRKSRIVQDEDNRIVLYKNEKGEVELRADSEKETIWAAQDQIARLFGTQSPAITKHLKNIFISGELVENEVCSKMEHTTKHGAMTRKLKLNLQNTTT